MLQRLGILVVTLANGLHIIFVIQGRDGPRVRILGIEEADLHNDASLAGLGDEVFQPREILRVPPVEVKLIATEAGMVASRPRNHETPWFGTERIALNEFSLRLEHC